MSDRTANQAEVTAATAKKFEATNQELSAMLAKLRGQVESLRAGWQGRGAVAFETTASRWNENVNKLNRALAETAHAIATAGVNYSTTDEQSAGRANAIDSGSVKLPL